MGSTLFTKLHDSLTFRRKHVTRMKALLQLDGNNILKSSNKLKFQKRKVMQGKILRVELHIWYPQ